MGRGGRVRLSLSVSLSLGLLGFAALLAAPAHAATKWPSCNIIGIATYRLDSSGGCPPNTFRPWRLVRNIHCDTGAIGGCIRPHLKVESVPIAQ